MKTLARWLRALADLLCTEEPEESVRVFSELPEYMITPVLEAISKAAFERAWPCRDCGKLLSVDEKFIRSEGPKWVKCGPCSGGWRTYDA